MAVAVELEVAQATMALCVWVKGRSPANFQCHQWDVLASALVQRTLTHERTRLPSWQPQLPWLPSLM